VDPNRAAFELDADLFEGPLPGYVDLNSAKARAGLGSIPSRVAGHTIYRSRLSFDEAQQRLRTAYWPYHHALQGMLAKAMREFGVVLLLDCHSMPTLGGNGSGSGDHVVDFALGDRFGRSCSAAVIEAAEAILRSRGFTVARNRPYAGGHITASYGCPEADIHALQIEVRRGLYMDERTLMPHAALDDLRLVVRDLLVELGRFVIQELTPPSLGTAAALPALPAGA
jgi:N-formylglutamate amidohydrolase